MDDNVGFVCFHVLLKNNVLHEFAEDAVTFVKLVCILPGLISGGFSCIGVISVWSQSHGRLEV